MIMCDLKPYPPLSDEQERDLARRYHAGDHAAGERFLLSNLGLVFLVLRRRYQHMPEQAREDLFQDGFLGLAHALKKFDPERGCRFGSYAVSWISYYMSRQANIYMSRDLSLDGPTSGKDGDEWMPADLLPEQQDPYVQVESALVAHQYLSVLDTRSRQIIEQRYGLGARSGDCASSGAVGECLAISGSRVRQLEQKAIATLAQQVEQIEREHR